MSLILRCSNDDSEKVKMVCAFSDERWTNGRSITDLDWSAKFHELVVAAYSKNPAAPNDPDGIVAVWNLHLLERPEFVFHSPVSRMTGAGAKAEMFPV